MKTLKAMQAWGPRKNIWIAGPVSQLHVSTVGTTIILTKYCQSSRTCKCFICQSTPSITSLGPRTCKFHADWIFNGNHFKIPKFSFKKRLSKLSSVMQLASASRSLFTKVRRHLTAGSPIVSSHQKLIWLVCSFWNLTVGCLRNNACQISEIYNCFNTQSHGFDSSLEVVGRYLTA